MSWNYRIVRRVHPNGEAELSVREAYYENSDDAIPYMITENPCGPHGETLEELQEDLLHIQAALTKPTLEYDEIVYAGFTAEGPRDPRHTEGQVTIAQHIMPLEDALPKPPRDR
jgi:hypothetical protein